MAFALLLGRPLTNVGFRRRFHASQICEQPVPRLLSSVYTTAKNTLIQLVRNVTQNPALYGSGQDSVRNSKRS
jgi:hypothetical protein